MAIMVGLNICIYSKYNNITRHVDSKRKLLWIMTLLFMSLQAIFLFTIILNSNKIIVLLFSGWLEPLLDRVAADPHLLVCPVINSIYATTFSVDGGQLGHYGILKLPDLTFNWGALPERIRKNRQVHDPIKYV